MDNPEASRHPFLAALLLALFSFFIAWRVRRTYGPSEPKRRYATISLAAVILTVLSFVTPPRSRSNAPADSAAGGRGGRDDYFSGVVLIAQPKPHPVRVPLLHRTPIRGGRASVSPLTIPFTGEFWFFYRPLPVPRRARWSNTEALPRSRLRPRMSHPFGHAGAPGTRRPGRPSLLPPNRLVR